MTTLITGGGSKIGSQVAQLLKASGRDVFFGSRSGRVPAGFDYVKLDWNDASTFGNAFNAPRQPGVEGMRISWSSSGARAPIESVYIVSPLTDVHAAPKIIPFVEMAVAHGVKRFVYLSATIADRNNDSGGLGELPGYFEDRGLDYFVLRPTWFMDNLLTDWGDEIRTQNQLTTALPTGRVPLISTEDIAQVAFEAITNDEIPFPSRDPLIIGPDLLSYNAVASILTEALGRKITHTVVSFEEMREFYRELYGPDEQEAADWLIELDRGIEAGSEVGLDKVEGAIIGKMTLRKWVQQRRALFNF